MMLQLVNVHFLHALFGCLKIHPLFAGLRALWCYQGYPGALSLDTVIIIMLRVLRAGWGPVGVVVFSGTRRLACSAAGAAGGQGGGWGKEERGGHRAAAPSWPQSLSFAELMWPRRNVAAW